MSSDSLTIPGSDAAQAREKEQMPGPMILIECAWCQCVLVADEGTRKPKRYCSATT